MAARHQPEEEIGLLVAHRQVVNHQDLGRNPLREQPLADFASPNRNRRLGFAGVTSNLPSYVSRHLGGGLHNGIVQIEPAEHKASRHNVRVQ